MTTCFGLAEESSNPQTIPKKMGDLGSGEDGISPIPCGSGMENGKITRLKMSWTMHPEKTRLRPTGIPSASSEDLGKMWYFQPQNPSQIGAIIVFAVVLCFIIILALIVSDSDWLHSVMSNPARVCNFWNALLVNDSDDPIILSSFAVHLWLPLLGVAILCLRFLNFVLWSFVKIQWFLKQGHLHPLDAIGYVAAVLVFLGTLASRALIGTSGTS
jgi:hypothetical protein